MKVRPVYIAFLLISLCLFFVIYFIFRGFGKKYDEGLASLIQKSPESQSTASVRKVRKVTVIHNDDKGCMEVTPDGIVRTYDTCGGELTDANRLADPKNVLHLIQIASQIDVSSYRKKISGPVLTLIIETDNGTETIYIPTNGGGGGGNDDVTKIVDLIEGDLPQPTATPGPETIIPTPTMGGVSFTPTPSPIYSPTPGPSPTPTPTPNPEVPFKCGYSQDPSSKKPFNVSNYICSTEPSPPPQ
jgi:hypothetical protein